MIRCQNICDKYLSCMSRFWPAYLYQKLSDQGLHYLPLNPYISEILFGSDHLVESKTFQISETSRKFSLKQFSSFNQVLSFIDSRRVARKLQFT